MAFDAFLKFTPTVAGESTDAKHTGDIEIYSFSLGAHNPVTIGSGTTGAGGGKVSFSGFSIMKKTDKTSPVLFQQCASGTHYTSALVTLRKAGGDSQVEYLKYTFGTVFVDSIQWSGSSGGDDTPMESVSMSYGSLQIDYTPQDAAGKPLPAIHGGWDVTKNQKA